MSLVSKLCVRQHALSCMGKLPTRTVESLTILLFAGMPIIKEKCFIFGVNLKMNSLYQ